MHCIKVTKNKKWIKYIRQKLNIWNWWQCYKCDGNGVKCSLKEFIKTDWNLNWLNIHCNGDQKYQKEKRNHFSIGGVCIGQAGFFILFFFWILSDRMIFRFKKMNNQICVRFVKFFDGTFCWFGLMQVLMIEIKTYGITYSRKHTTKRECISKKKQTNKKRNKNC